MQFRTLAMMTVLAMATTTSVTAAVIEGINWADDAAEYSSKIQNYGGTLMDASTEWWLTGPSDADVDGNGYAWDAGDLDYVGGWRSNAPNEYITMYWETGLSDVSGDDLTIHLYGGSSALAKVLASTDGTEFIQIGTIGGGTAGYFRDEAFDFAGLFGEIVQYVRVERVANGPQTGIFFDSFAGVVPEPATLVLLACGTCALIRRKNRA